ncbi:MAG: hypothetical protein IKR92_01120 [Alphaproteobacteria bacterium]|nr:hypothetical protein [Alphaproteobacteria bacterium]
MTEKSLAQEFTKKTATMIGKPEVASAIDPRCGARPEDLKKMYANAVMAEFENNRVEAIRPGCGMPLQTMKEVFGQELAEMLPNALAAKSPSPEQMFVIEQAYLKLQERNNDAKPQTNAFADLAKNVAPQSKVDFMAKFREQHMKGM